MQSISELQKKEVINIHDGTRLGFVYDLEIDVESGKVIALKVPNGSKMFSVFGKVEDYVIPWDKIKKIGDDIILVSDK